MNPELADIGNVNPTGRAETYSAAFRELPEPIEVPWTPIKWPLDGYLRTSSASASSRFRYPAQLREPLSRARTQHLQPSEEPYGGRTG